MSGLKSVCVYCGSSFGRDPEFVAAARELGEALAAAEITLVYGGGSIGLMGTIANRVIECGGQVTGVIPQFLRDREIMLREVTDLVITKDMHERKRRMFDRSDGFVALPGGIGTLEELVEMLTWSQLGQHDKPIVVANISGFWDPLRRLLDHMVETEFVSAADVNACTFVDKVEDVIPTLVRRHEELAAARSPENSLLRNL